MMYLSKGSAWPTMRGTDLWISRCGKTYPLGPALSALWRRGRVMPQKVLPGQEYAVRRMAESGLVAITEEEGDLGAYQLVTSCVLCPCRRFFPRLPLRGRERRLWTWISRAGLRLTASELVRLEEQEAIPRPELLGVDGRQPLTELIYTSLNIFDGVLDAEMERSDARDRTVSALLRLLKSRRLLLI